jgi:hypothetical protein
MEIHSLAHEFRYVRQLEIIFFATKIDARNVEHILDQRGKPLAFLDDETEIFPLFLRLDDAARVPVLPP